MWKDVSKEDKIISIAVLVYFFGTIIAAVIFAEINENYCLMTFGQLFVVAGFVLLLSELSLDRGVQATFSKTCGAILFLVMGGGAFVLGYNNLPDEVAGFAVMKFVGAVLGTIGLVIMWLYRSNNDSLKYYTEKVVAKRKDIDELKREIFGDENSAPEIHIDVNLYEYEFGSRLYNYNMPYSMNIADLMPETIELYINPEKPNKPLLELKEETPKRKLISLLGIGIIIIGVLILFMPK